MKKQTKQKGMGYHLNLHKKMTNLNGKQTARIAEYIKMFKGDIETLNHAWENTWEQDDLDDYYNLNVSRVEKYITDLKNIVYNDSYNKKYKELLKECEMIYQQWLMLKK